MYRIVPSLLFLSTLSAVSSAWAQQSAQTWEISTGIDYSVGEYGAASDTTVIGVPFDVKMRADRLRLELTVSYLNLEGPGAFVGSPGTLVIVDPGAGQVTTRSGLGDTNLRGAFAFYRSADAASGVEAAGTVKLATAKSGLGTGKMDYTAQMNLYHSVSPRFILSGLVGYQWLGDFQNFGLKDGMVGNLGLNLRPNDTTAMGVTLAYRQEPWEGIGEQVSLAPYIAWRIRQDWGVTAYGTVGLTEASPRFGTGLRLTLFK